MTTFRKCILKKSFKSRFKQKNKEILPWHNVRPFPFILSAVRRDQPRSAAITFQVLAESNKDSPQPPFPQTKQPQFLQSLLIGHILQALPQPCCPSLDLLQHLHVLSVLRCPKLNTVLEVRPHQC